LRLLLNGQRSTADIPRIQQRLEGINQHMLHFLENHDEQRVASKDFAGDMWRAIPAMVISATIDKGPVMIYFGQEVGEPGNGAEGFGGDDGRTSIFDYWGVPEHQKWMNGGKFDGGQLSMEQKQLRQVYADLLTLARKSPAIAQGTYEDITEFNIGRSNFGTNVHAFLRYTDNERLLIVNTFHNKEQVVKVTIPEEAAARMGLDRSQTYIARDLLWRDTEVGFDRDLTFELKLRPFGSYIFKIK
jgi:glycosidase